MMMSATPTKTRSSRNASPNPVQIARDFLSRIIESISYGRLREACNKVISNNKFLTSIGSAGKHHAYEGGLLCHTAEVMRIALAMASEFPGVNMDVLKTAIVFHDFCKIHEYHVLNHVIDHETSVPVINKTDYRNLVRHVSGSYAEFMIALESSKEHGDDIPEEIILDISHCILSHHGRPEWGSAIEPQTVEAMIIHYADNLSAKYGPAKLPAKG